MNVALEHRIGELQITPSMAPPRGRRPDMLPHPSFMPCRTDVVALVAPVPSILFGVAGIAIPVITGELRPSAFMAPPRWHYMPVRGVHPFICAIRSQVNDFD